MDPVTEDTLRQALQRAMDTASVEMVDGRKNFVLSCRSGQLRMQLGFHYRQAPARAPGTETPETRAAGAIAAPAEGIMRLEGVASSTSQDWYGTEMSKGCLEDLGLQFGRGVGVFPSHGSWVSGLGWDDQMGKTVSAELERAAVAAPADATEPGYLLRTIMDLDLVEESCKKLKNRLERGQEIGLSIGGYFLQIRYIMKPNDEYEIERIIVEKLELDHLAVVRNPANPDSMGLRLLRSIPADAFRSKRDAYAARSTDGAPATPAAAPAAEAPAEEAPVTSEDSAPPPAPPEDAAPSTEEEAAPITTTADDATRSTPTEFSMTAEQIAELVRNSVNAALDARAAAAPAAAASSTTTPAPAAGETIEQVRAKLQAEANRAANLERAMAHINASGVRSGSAGGRSAPTGALNKAGIEGLVQRAKAEGKAPMLVRVISGDPEQGIQGIQGHLSVNLRAKGGEAAVRLAEAKDAAPDMLRDIFDAANADGTLREWKAAAVAA